LPQAEGAELGLEAADLREAFAGDLRPVRDAAREARARGLVPDGEAEDVGGAAHVVLAEPALDENAPDARVPGGVEARTVVAQVVGVRAVEDVGEAPLARLDLGDLVELRFAVKAAVGRVGDVAGALDLVRLDELVARSDLLGHRHRRLFFERCEARRDGGHADGAAP
jgi:hypothetical protein